MTPYDKYESTEEWRIINKVLQELIDNGDIKLLTPIDYIILNKTTCRKREYFPETRTIYLNN